MKPLAVARRYARALADVAGQDDPKILDKTTREISLAARAIAGDPAILRFFDDPSVRKEDKDAAIKTVGRQGKLSQLSLRFLAVLVENRRMSALRTIDEVLQEIRDERLGLVQAEATMAVSPTKAEQQKMKQALEKMTGRTVHLSVKIDPDVLGGARTRIGSRVYDGTLRNQLAILRKRLAMAR